MSGSIWLIILLVSVLIPTRMVVANGQGQPIALCLARYLSTLSFSWLESLNITGSCGADIATALGRVTIGAGGGHFGLVPAVDDSYILADVPHRTRSLTI